MYAHGYPQRIRCKHCGRYQVENFTRKGKIYIAEIGKQFSTGPQQNRKLKPISSGSRILRAYAKEIRERFDL